MVAVVPIQRVCQVIKSSNMKSPKRDILVVVRNQFLDDKAISQEVECLNEILRRVESNDVFCIAHEIADRYRISSKPRRILKAIRFLQLKPFCFLLNKN